MIVKVSEWRKMNQLQKELAIFSVANIDMLFLWMKEDAEEHKKMPSSGN